MFQEKHSLKYFFKRLLYTDRAWQILWVGLLGIAIIVGFTNKNETNEHSFSYSACMLEELTNNNVISVSNYMDSIRSGEEHGLVNYLAENQEFYLNECISSSVKAVVRPTGRLFLEKESLGQEFEVIRVIEGSDVQSGDFAVGYIHASITERIGMLNFNGLANLMNPEYTYAVFMEPSALNPYQKRKEFYFESELFPYIRIGENGNNYKVLDSFSLADCLEAEFMTVKDENLNKLYEIKELLIEKTGLK